MNLGGAKDRPVLSEVLNNVKAKLDGEAAVHEKIRTFGAGSLLKKKLFG
jgi:hypothetical protein